jgi:hypothetical protein
MLPLGRHVMTTYFSPLTSKVPSFPIPRIGSGGSFDRKNGGVAVSMTEYENHRHPTKESQGAVNTSTIGLDSYNQGNYSLDSQREMLRVPPKPDQYTVDVVRGETRTDDYYTNGPMRTIPVDRDVRVT